MKMAQVMGKRYKLRETYERPWGFLGVTAARAKIEKSPSPHLNRFNFRGKL